MTIDELNLKRGWILSNNENGDIVIQKYDESDRFKSDDEATEFVVKSYDELLQELELLNDTMIEYENAGHLEGRVFDKLKHRSEFIDSAINKANGD